MILFSNIAVLRPDGTIASNQFVAVEGDTIRSVGEDRPPGKAEWNYDGRGRLLLPGFYNAHAHSPMTLLRGYGENLRLQDWLTQRVFPFENQLDGNAVYQATKLAMAESMRFGIVSTTDMYYFSEDMARAVSESGMKSNLSRAIVFFTEEDLWGDSRFLESKALYENWHGAENGRIRVDLCMHAEYTSTPKSVRQLAEYAKETGAGVTVHVAETQKEQEECRQRHGGQTPVEYLADCGFFDTPATAAHCVWLTDRDRDILVEKGVTVASCPVSNMKLASGICDVPALLERGIPVAIGTDGAASNNSLNFLEEMKFFALGAKVKHLDPTLITPAETLRAASLTGARSQGRERCGIIEAGYQADLIVLDLDTPNMQPVHDLATSVVYSAAGSDVRLTMVDGKILYEDGEYRTIDLEKTIYETEKAKDKILSALKG